MAKDFDKQKWAAEQEAFKQKLTDTVNDIIANYEDSPEEIAELLAFKAKFHSYSVGNAILMQNQNPYAAFVASFQKFKEMGYSVKKGEHGMKIFVPVTVTLLKDEDGSWTPLSKASDELKLQAKAGLTEKRTVTRYKLGTVFDISQTNCPVEDYPQIYHVGYPSERHGLLANALTAFCEQTLHCPVTQENLTSISLHGRYIRDGHCIVLNDKLEDTHRLCTLTHEMGHAVLHDAEKVPTVQAELEADAFSILLESYLGIPLTDTRKRHLAGHYQQLKDERSKNPDLPTLTEMLKRACSRFNELLPEMQKYLPKDEQVFSVQKQEDAQPSRQRAR